VVARGVEVVEALAALTCSPALTEVAVSKQAAAREIVSRRKGTLRRDMIHPPVTEKKEDNRACPRGMPPQSNSPEAVVG
jgi:hypothetical protein